MPEYAPWQAPDWSELHSPALIDRLAEYLGNTPATEPDEELADFARETASRHQPGETARLICSFLHDAIKYVPGATTVHTPATHAWAERSGVCQDFAHSGHRRAAHGRHPRALRVRLPAPQPLVRHR